MFSSCASVTVDRPRNIKIIVSDTELSIFMKYLTVVDDLSLIFASTYCFMKMPQKTMLKDAETWLYFLINSFVFLRLRNGK